MAKGKVHHWKHGWIPLDAFARAVVARREGGNSSGLSRKAQADADRRARYIAHQNAMRERDDAKRARYIAHQNELARKRQPVLALKATPTNPDSLGEQIKPNPDEMTAVARGGGHPYSADHITPDGRFTPEREALHRQIIEAHLAGIQPTGKRPVQYMNGGGPGSGKSSLRTGDNGRMTGYPATREVDDMTGEVDTSQPAGAVLIDPDAIKMMLPEVKAARADGASDWAARSHEESSYLAKRVHAAALDRGLDLVYDGTGDGGLASVEKKIALGRAKGYRVEGNYIYLEPDAGVSRAMKRGERTGRVVPEATIRETYKDVSSTFGQVADKGAFDTLRVFDNNQPSGAPAKLIAEFKKGQSPNVRDAAAYRRFLANGE